MIKTMLKALTGTVAAVGFASAAFAGPDVVSGPGVLPDCFAPKSADTKFFQWKKKDGPYRIALANGFVGNTWRIQMIKTAKAYSEQPDVAKDIKELKVVSTGTDVAAQIAAIENFINSGYDAILTIAVNPTAFTPVIKKANRANVVLVPFDNTFDSDEVMMVNEDQLEMGKIMGRWITKNVPNGGKILEVRGLPGNSVDRDRHLGFREIVEAADAPKYEIVEVVGNWDDGTAQKVTADAVAVHKHFDGMFVQGGSTGAVRALMDAGHPFIPVAGEAENGFRKLCAEHAKDGLLCSSAGQSPGLVAIAMKSAISALKGDVMPQFVSVPIPLTENPDFKPGENYYPDLGDNFFTPNEFPPCGVNIKATEIMGQSESDQ
ncbi:MAG TPA: sugar ABC transporter substrate-binding protein [Aestuariivirga sp.]|nr:ABC transporter substrate-binding protein [Alphaproteobacteria bacterium]HRX35004.1 sugar ABC transporter substrate-binding protein [Aestuariivirga sp.]